MYSPIPRLRKTLGGQPNVHDEDAVLLAKPSDVTCDQILDVVGTFLKYDAMSLFTNGLESGFVTSHT